MKKLSMMVCLVIAVGLTVGCARKAKTAKAEKSSGNLQRIHFDFDKSHVKPEFESVLKNNAAWAQSNNNKKIVIEGHCDERGANEYNIALGDRRAMSTKKYMEGLGIPSNQLSTVSYGEERPMSNCHDESCWWQNRRADFTAK